MLAQRLKTFAKYTATFAAGIAADWAHDIRATGYDVHVRTPTDSTDFIRYDLSRLTDPEARAKFVSRAALEDVVGEWDGPDTFVVRSTAKPDCKTGFYLWRTIDKDGKVDGWRLSFYDHSKTWNILTFKSWKGANVPVHRQ